MRFFRIIAGICLAAVTVSAQAPTDFSGAWTLNAAASRIGQMPVAPPASMKIEQTGDRFTVAMGAAPDGPSTTAVYSLQYGKSEKGAVGEYAWNSATKWEGSALLVNTIVTGPQDYTQDDRWERSRDGHRLTIERTIRVRGLESESVLIYEDGQAPPMTSAAPPPLRERPSAPVTSSTSSRTTAASSRNVTLMRPREDPAPMVEPSAQEFVVASGTRILLRLTNALNTKRTAVGDKIYLQTAAPVFVNKQLVIPVGSYVTGVVTESERAGRVKGKSGLNLRFESLTLSNGVSRDFRSRAGSVDTAGNLDRTEGRISGESGKGQDAQTVAKTTAAGTGVGAIAGAAAGHLGMGAGIGAAAGALGGLAGVLASRGPEVVLPAGTTMEMVLDRDVSYSIMELPNR